KVKMLCLVSEASKLFPFVKWRTTNIVRLIISKFSVLKATGLEGQAVAFDLSVLEAEYVKLGIADREHHPRLHNRASHTEICGATECGDRLSVRRPSPARSNHKRVARSR